MGVHTNAEKIVKEFNFKPGQAHVTTHHTLPGTADRTRAAEDAVEAMGKLLTDEGIVRIYALLKSSTLTMNPKFDIGTGGKLLVTAMAKKLDPARKKTEIQAELQELKEKIGDIETKLKSE